MQNGSAITLPHGVCMNPDTCFFLVHFFFSLLLQDSRVTLTSSLLAEGALGADPLLGPPSCRAGSENACRGAPRPGLLLSWLAWGWPC